MRRRLLTAVVALALAAGLVAAVEMGRSNGHGLSARARATAPMDAPTPSKVEELTYRTSGGRRLGITLRRAARPRGLVVLVHGGGFRSGSRRAMDGWARLLTADGYATASIDYRLAGPREHSRERALARAAADTLAALGRLQSDSPLRRLPVVLWGYSAGALTVLRVAADHPQRVRASVSLAGYGEPGRIRAGNPPMLLFNGTADRSEPVSKADATCRAARAVGVRCRQVVYPGVTHALPETRGPSVHRTARAWLASVLGH
jgi:dipeptidyl aminopeptidase/acylaminoacyl peptidase